MAQATQLILQKNNADLVNQVLNSNQPTKIVAEEGMQITLIDSKTGQPAKKLQAKKVADNLLIADENGEALLTIEDYYLTDNITLGTVSDIGFVEFNYVSAETGATTQIASETSYTTLVSEMLGDASLIEGISNGALLGSIGAAALGVAAISSNSSDSSPKLPANELPVSKNSNIEATEDTVATGQLEAATDADSDNLTYAIKDNAANGTVIVNADGSYSYTPDTDFNGEDSFTYTIDDGQGGMTTQTATITVAAVNDAPVAEDSSISTDEDTVAKGQLVATDIDGDDLTFALDTDANNGTVVVNADGSYSYTPNDNFNGSDSFTYTITDGTETITQTATITVASVNDLPVSKNSNIEATEDTVATGQLEAATDADSDNLTYAIKDNAANGTVIVNADGSYSYTPDTDFNGEDSFTYTIDDGQGGMTTQTATITVAAVNDAPVAEDSSISTDEDTVAKGQLVATDIDGDDLTFALDTDANNGTVVVNADGSYSYTPNDNFNGSDSFTYTITDGTETITQTATITVASVNDLPVSKNSNIEATEDTVATGQLEAATDADSDNLTYAIKDNAANGTVIVNADGSYSYTPDTDFNGEDSFTYTIDDGQGGMITQTATITVAAVNDAPVAEDSSISTDEDTVAKGQLVATDVDGDNLTFALDSGASNGTAIVNASGSYSYTPNANFNGSDSFTYTITDGTETITQTATITVASVNDLPVSTDSSSSTNEDAEATGTLATATDADGDELTYALKDTAVNGTVIVNADGSYSYTPNANFNGSDSFIYSIDDGQGGVITQTATIDVAPINDAPVAEDSVIAAIEDTVAEGQLATATDVDGDELTFVLATDASNGTVVVNADGSYSYTPNTNFNGSDNFTYTITDGTETITQTANVTVNSFSEVYNRELQGTFETTVVSEKQVLVDKQSSNTLYDTIVFEVTGDNAGVTLSLFDSSRNINANGSYTLTGPSGSSSGNINVFSAGSSSYNKSLGSNLSPGIYTLSIGIQENGSTISLDVVEFKDVEKTEFVGYQSIMGNIFADDDGGINAPNDYELQINGQSLISQASSSASSPIVIDTDNGQLELSADGSYIYRSNGNELGLDPDQLAEKFDIKVVDLQGSYIGAYRVNITSDTMPPEPGELVFNNFEDTGISQDDGVTQDNTFDLTIKNNEADSQVEYQYSTDQGATWAVLANGTASNLADGDYSFRAKVTDEALNESFTAVRDITIDTTAPILGQILNFNTATNQLEVNADIDQDTLQAFKLENGTLVPLADVTNIPFVEGNYQIQASDVAGNSTSLDFVMSTASEYFESADIIDIVKGSVGNDYIYGDNGDDILISNGGSDHLNGEAGNDTLIYGGNSSGNIRFNGGQGDDAYVIDVRDFVNSPLLTIQDYNGVNRLNLKGVNPSDINLTRNDNSLEISTADGKINLYDQFETGSSFAGVDNIYFDDGTVWDKETIDTLTGGKIVGTDGDDVLTLDSENSVLYGGDGNDTLTGSVNDDYIYGGNGDDILISNGGSDHLNGEAGNDTLIYGGNSSGNIRFNGGQGDDAYVIDVRDFVNSPLLTIQDYNGVNRLNLKGVNPSDINLTRNDNSLEISTADGKINLYDQFETGSSFAGVDNIYFDDGTVWDKADIESMVNTGGSNARSIMSFDEAEDSSNDAYSTSDDFIDMSSLGGNIDMYHGNNAALAFNNTDATIQMITFVDSEQIKLPKIDDLLDVNNNELVFESADVVSANTANETATKVFNVASEPSTAVDFTIGQVQALNDNMQTEAMFHII
ncbi:MAG: hypothetical protein BAX61_04635 [Psychrobacter sp. B29-1]|uniref:tandem-95 repeat protein n=12 Tax=Psychrobacter TaxID=497 RepID=UPI0008685997|nr:Ig-like domain-containing protein [Psychrobacter sp. B29-1]OEH68093.1 MAG: hypothetical protein BAX61_04635 [Psychrobacter sp. B29-1]